MRDRKGVYLELHTSEELVDSRFEGFKTINRGKPFICVYRDGEMVNWVELVDGKLHYKFSTEKLTPHLKSKVRAWFDAYLSNPVDKPGHLWTHMPGRGLRVGIISCGKDKLEKKVKAKNLYRGELFKKCRAWVEKNCDEWGILSARHGLLLPDDEILPYDQTLREMDPQWRHGWAQTTSGHVYTMWGEDTHYVLLCGELYRLPFSRSHLRGARVTTHAPMRGLGIGEQLGWLKRSMSSSHTRSRSRVTR